MHLDGLAILAAVMGVVVIAALAAAVLSFRRRRREIAWRIRKDLAPKEEPETLEVGAWMAQTLRPLAKLAKPASQEELSRLRRDLGRAGLRSAHAAEIFMASKILLGVAGLAVLFAWRQGRAAGGVPLPMIGVVLFAAGYYAPTLWLRGRVGARRRAIERGLADTLDLLVTCVEAGLGLDAALQRVIAETKLPYPALGAEMELTFLEIAAGLPRVEAFRRMADRTGVDDLKSLAATLTQTEMFGTSISGALRVQAEGIRVRRMQRAEELAAYVSVKMTVPLITLVLPALVVLLVGPAIVRIVNQGGLFGGR